MYAVSRINVCTYVCVKVPLYVRMCVCVYVYVCVHVSMLINESKKIESCTVLGANNTVKTILFRQCCSTKFDI